MYEWFGGSSDYKNNGIKWLLLGTIDALQENNESLRVNYPQPKYQYKSLRASWVTHKEMQLVKLESRKS